MNDTMNPEQNQEEMTPEEAKASMGIATHLQTMLMPQAPQTPNPDQGVPQNQQTPKDVETQIQGLESRIMDELQTLREEMKAKGDSKELADLKKQIEAVLNE